MTRNLKEFVNHGPGPSVPLKDLGNTHVAVLLGHYNGGAYLAEQLESLGAQSHRDWSLIVSDDGSTDRWLETMADFSKAVPKNKVWLHNGPGNGFAQNFLSLVDHAGPTVPYAAFCDQDDVWMHDKLERALSALAKVRPGQPALYCGRTMVCDRNLNPIGLSPLFRRLPGFGNALVQNIGGGNTMVMNRAALDILQDTRAHATSVVSHDWWAYQILSGAGGRILYDAEPSVMYRQHGQNLVGANQSWVARARRMNRILRGDFRAWNRANNVALRRATHWLTPEARRMLAAFDEARNARSVQRLSSLAASGIYRQTVQGNLALYVAAALRRL